MENLENILVLGSNISNSDRIGKVARILNGHPAVLSWSVDPEDIDNVLRIESKGGLREDDVVELIATEGLKCIKLPD